jgi:hypothetical protein
MEIHGDIFSLIFKKIFFLEKENIYTQIKSAFPPFNFVYAIQSFQSIVANVRIGIIYRYVYVLDSYVYRCVFAI